MSTYIDSRSLVKMVAMVVCHVKMAAVVVWDHVKVAEDLLISCQNGGRGRRISYKSGGKSADVISIWLAGKLILFLSKMAILQSADL